MSEKEHPLLSKDPENNVISQKVFDDFVSTIFDDMSDAVKHTLGPAGANTMLFTMDMGTPVYPSKDGYNILSQLIYKNPVHHNIYQLIYDIAVNMNSSVGDGTTSSIVIAADLYKRLRKRRTQFVDKDKILTPLGFRNLLGLLDEILKNELKEKYIIPVENLSREQKVKIYNKIATVSANNDSKIGKYISDLYQDSDDVMVLPELGSRSKTDIKEISGFELGSGFIHPSMTTEPDRSTAIHKKPRFLIADGPITDNDMHILLRTIEYVCVINKQPLVIVAEVYTQEVISYFIENAQMGTIFGNDTEKEVRHKLPILAMVLSSSTELGAIRLNDMVVALGGKLLPSRNQQLLAGVKNPTNEEIEEFCGGADEIISNKFITRIIGGKGNREEINTIVNKLETQIKEKIELNDNVSDTEIYKYRKRIAMLTGKMVRIEIGGISYKERAFRRLMLEDAVQAVTSTISNGYTISGNISVKHLIKHNKDKIINKIIEKIEKDNINISYTKSDTKDSKNVQKAIDVILEDIGDSFFEAYNQVLVNAYGKNFNDEINTEDLIKGDVPKIYNIFKNLQESINITDLISPGNTDLEIMSSVFVNIGLLLSVRRMMPWSGLLN